MVIACVASSSARSEAPSNKGSSSSGAAVPAMAEKTRVKAVATIKVTVGGVLNSLRPSRAIDDFKDLIGRSLYLELVSSQLDASEHYSLYLPKYVPIGHAWTCSFFFLHPISLVLGRRHECAHRRGIDRNTNVL